MPRVPDLSYEDLGSLETVSQRGRGQSAGSSTSSFARRRVVGIAGPQPSARPARARPAPPLRVIPGSRRHSSPGHTLSPSPAAPRPGTHRAHAAARRTRGALGEAAVGCLGRQEASPPPLAPLPTLILHPDTDVFIVACKRGRAFGSSAALGFFFLCFTFFSFLSPPPPVFFSPLSSANKSESGAPELQSGSGLRHPARSFLREPRGGCCSPAGECPRTVWVAAAGGMFAAGVCSGCVRVLRGNAGSGGWGCLEGAPDNATSAVPIRALTPVRGPGCWVPLTDFSVVRAGVGEGRNA